MNYDETIQYLYDSVPVFQHSGASAYKPGLKTSIVLSEALDNPYRAYKTIHVAGTNGKGSVCHLLAAILQKSGYKTGLYTSPHLVDFRERIRINGQMISKEYVVDFVEKHKDMFEPLHPSFFELTSTMAFDYFRHEKVDFAIIETGLGGRLDSTNIITPVLSIITNISPDHQQYLGETLEDIAREKAGIIKPLVPVLIGECLGENPDEEIGNPETDTSKIIEVFASVSERNDSPLLFAEVSGLMGESYLMNTGEWYIKSADYGQLFGQLSGAAQIKNALTVLSALRILEEQGIGFTKEAVREGFEHVVEITGLRGRWEVLGENPRIVCDTGHNEGAWEYLTLHLRKEMQFKRHLHMIIGLVNDKDAKKIVDLMPEEATYYFTQASVQRALPSELMAAAGLLSGLSGFVCDTVEEAVNNALSRAKENDLLFIGGSTFVVADALQMERFKKNDL